MELRNNQFVADGYQRYLDGCAAKAHETARARDAAADQPRNFAGRLRRWIKRALTRECGPEASGKSARKILW
jgi:hypothetical protein